MLLLGHKLQFERLVLVQLGVKRDDFFAKLPGVFFTIFIVTGDFDLHHLDGSQQSLDFRFSLVYPQFLLNDTSFEFVSEGLRLTTLVACDCSRQRIVQQLVLRTDFLLHEFQFA